MRRLSVIFCALSFCSCSGPDQILTECDDYLIPGQWEEVGSLRDVVAQKYRDPGDDVHVYWCPPDQSMGILEFGMGGWYLGCGEIYALDDERAMRWLRHEVGHCFAYRLWSNPESGHGAGRGEHPDFWAAVE